MEEFITAVWGKNSIGEYYEGIAAINHIVHDYNLSETIIEVLVNMCGVMAANYNIELWQIIEHAKDIIESKKRLNSNYKPNPFSVSTVVRRSIYEVHNVRTTI